MTYFSHKRLLTLNFKSQMSKYANNEVRTRLNQFHWLQFPHNLIGNITALNGSTFYLSLSEYLTRIKLKKKNAEYQFW